MPSPYFQLKGKRNLSIQQSIYVLQLTLNAQKSCIFCFTSELPQNVARDLITMQYGKEYLR